MIYDVSTCLSRLATAHGRTILLCACAVSMLLPHCSGERILLSNFKREPSWVYDIPRNSIVASGNGSNAEEAQKAALDRVKQEIVERISSEILTSRNVTVRAVDSNGAFNRTDAYSSNVKIMSAYSGFLSGISIANVENYYWKKVRKAGNIYFTYLIRYPFLQKQLDSLISDWNAKQADYRRRVLNLESRQENSYRTFEEIYRDREEANLLAKSMVDKDDIAKASFIASMRSQLISTATIDAQQKRIGLILCRLLVNGKPIETENWPRLEQSCITIDSTSGNGAESRIFYRYDQCNCRQENTAKIAYSFSTWTLSAHIPIDLSTICIGFLPNGVFNSDLVRENKGLLGFGGTLKRTFRLDLSVLYKGSFAINGIDYIYTRKGMFGSKEIRGSVDRLWIPSNGRSVIPVVASRPASELEKDESAGDYVAFITVYYTDMNTKKANKLSFDNVPFRITKRD